MPGAVVAATSRANASKEPGYIYVRGGAYRGLMPPISLEVFTLVIRCASITAMN